MMAVATVWREFPGFRLDELLSLTEDGRENVLEIWVVEARRAQALRQLEAIQAASYPHMGDKERQRMVADLRREARRGVDRVVTADEEAKREAEWAKNREAARALLGGAI